MERDDDEDMEPTHGMYGTLECSVPSKELSERPSCVSSGTLSVLRCPRGQRNIGGMWRGEVRCIGPRRKGRRCVDLDLGGVVYISTKRHTGRGRAYGSRKCSTCRSSKVHHRRS